MHGWTPRRIGKVMGARARLSAVGLLVTAILATGACGGAAVAGGGASPHPSSVAGGTPRSESMASLMARLSPAQLAGQRVIYSYHGLTPPPRLLRAISSGEAAGVIFFGQNIAGSAQLRSVAAQLQRAADQSPVPLPLLLMSDQEGGVVRRLPGGPALSERQVGASADPAAAARQAGLEAAAAVRAAGLNVDLAPVLDVYRRPGDFLDQLARSYSRDPAVVSACGAASISAQQDAGISATAKHFPGLGAATAGQNTDKRPVTLRVSPAQLRAVDEAPYAAAVAAHVRLVMLSWATYPALDPARPAGLSPLVVGELRERMGFTGVTITDALGAGALRAFGQTPERAVLAAGAGMDLLLCAGKRADEGTSAVEGLTGALDGGVLDKSAFTASVRRVLELRSGLAQ